MAATLLLTTCLLYMTVSCLEGSVPAYSRQHRSSEDTAVGNLAPVSINVEVDDAVPPLLVTTHMATILKHSMPAGPGDKMAEIYVDNTIRELTIGITAATITGNPTSVLTDPDGTVKPPIPGRFGQTTLTDKAGGVRIIKIQNPKTGVWHLTKKDPVLWNVEVTAKSTIDFTTKFEQTVNGVKQELTGRPTSGEKVTVIFTVSQINLIKSLDRAILIDSNGVPLGMAGLSPGSTASEFTGELSLPKKPFQLNIMGTDSAGNTLQRVDTTKTISPVAMKLTIGNISSPLYVDEDLTISYTVENLGDKTIVVTVDIKDDKGFVPISPGRNYTLDAGKMATGNYILHAGKTVGVITTVTLSAQADSSPHNEVRKLTVEERKDVTDPVCNVTSVTGSCSVAQMDPCNCHKNTWSGKAQFGDVGSGLFQVTSTVKKPGTFIKDSFAAGDKGLKTANIKSDCCNPVVTINVMDMANNTGQCKFDLAPGLTAPSTPCKTTVATTSTAATVAIAATTAPSAIAATTAPVVPLVTAAPVVPLATAAPVVPLATAAPVATVAAAIKPGKPGIHGSSVTDSVRPVCNVTGKHGRCSKEQVYSEKCDDYIWFGTVQFGDEGSGLLMVKSTAGESGALTTDSFTKGDTISSGLKSGKLIATCCDALAYVIVVDIAGNTGQCELDVRETQIYDQSDASSSDNLSPGAIAGITVGAIAGLVGTIVAAVLITKFGRCCTQSPPNTNTGRFRTTAWE